MSNARKSNAEITDHYSFGGLRDRIQLGLDQLDGAPSVAALGPVDEFHVGGRPATQHLIEQLDLGASDHILDIGSGLGGTARFIASQTAARVTGIDLTAEYVQVATWLTELVGLQDRCTFVLGSAAELPPTDEPFTAATMVHVGMNIDAKEAVFSQVAAAIGPGGRFAIYDIMLASDGQPTFPVPWAASSATSHLESAATYASLLENAGFEIVATADRTEAALNALAQLGAAAADGPPPLGLHLVMGPTTPTKVANMAAAIREGILATTEIVARVQ